MVQVLSQSHPNARKAHICDHCGGGIEAGESYDRAFLKDGGETWSWVSHQDCSAMANRLHRDMDLCWDEGICLREVWSDDHDAIRLYADEFPAVIARLEGKAGLVRRLPA